uniref:AIG1-type G domain-containing protein n=1 Tax=Oryzias latipes TaxID=8090 RepID=A0A3P9H7K1_ORYLA
MWKNNSSEPETSLDEENEDINVFIYLQVDASEWSRAGILWAGKSSSANTILRQKKFDFGRIRTHQSKMIEGVVGGRKLAVVDTSGWRSSLCLSDVPQRDQQRFRLNVSKCPPGPNAFLLVIPVDSAFSVEQKITVEEHMKLLGEHAWRFSMVLFTFGDFLGEKTIEEHIECEGPALRWLIEKCGNRYHMFNNKDKDNSSQVSLLLEKIDEMARNNSGRCYEVDQRILKKIRQKQEEVASRAKERRRKAEEERQRELLGRREGSPVDSTAELCTNNRRRETDRQVQLIVMENLKSGKINMDSPLGFQKNLKNLKLQLNDIINKQTQFQIQRLRLERLEISNKSGKFLANQLKINREKSSITSITDQTGNVTHDPVKINNAFENFIKTCTHHRSIRQSKVLTHFLIM